MQRQSSLRLRDRGTSECLFLYTDNPNELSAVYKTINILVFLLFFVINKQKHKIWGLEIDQHCTYTHPCSFSWLIFSLLPVLSMKKSGALLNVTLL